MPRSFRQPHEVWTRHRIRENIPPRGGSARRCTGHSARALVPRLQREFVLAAQGALRIHTRVCTHVPDTPP